MKAKPCLYDYHTKCSKARWRHTPFCKEHYNDLVTIIVPEQEQDGGANGLKTLINLGSNLANQSQKITQGLTQASRLAETGLNKAEEASNLINQGIGRAQELTSRAQALADNSSQQFGNLYNNFVGDSDSEETRDVNYSEPSLTVSSPLSPNSGQNFQTFGDYICLKKDFVRDLRVLFNELFAKRNVEV